ncbi:unnamed protein product [Choristocarpus tenellus]
MVAASLPRLGHALRDAADLRKFSASLGVFFKIPDQGMKDYNILARATTTPVLEGNGKNSRLRFLAPAHTVSPWKFPHFYPADWLSYVNETHVKYFMELRESTGGAVLTSYELAKPVLHPTRDLAALQFFREDDAIDDMKRRGLPFLPLKLRDRPLEIRETVRVVGYEVIETRKSSYSSEGNKNDSVSSGADVDSEKGNDPKMLMVNTLGGLTARTQHQAFLWTEAELNPGMCGSALVDEALECCGCVEGVVPMKPPEEKVSEAYRLVEGNACFIESPDILLFLQQIQLK